jgi:hypothetical protein
LKASAKCRPREVPDDCPYPFTGDDGDADAIRLLLTVQRRIIKAYGPQPGDRAMGEFMSDEDLAAFTLLNHMEAYLDNREEYAKIADELRGYLVID